MIITAFFFLLIVLLGMRFGQGLSDAVTIVTGDHYRLKRDRLLRERMFKILEAAKRRQQEQARRHELGEMFEPLPLGMRYTRNADRPTVWVN